MSTDTRVPPAEITGLKGALVTRFATKMLGKVPASVGVLWHHQKLMTSSMSIGRKVESWDELPEDLATYAAMASAATIGCSFCLDLTHFMAGKKDLDEDKLHEVPRWRESTAFTDLERDVMEYAEGASTTPVTVTDELSDRLLAALGPAGLVELAARVGFMNMTARTNVALGIHSEEFALACGMRPLASASVVADA